MHTYVTDVYANSEIDYSSPKVEMSQDSTAESRKMTTNTFTVAANMRKHLFYYITNYQKKNVLQYVLQKRYVNIFFVICKQSVE